VEEVLTGPASEVYGPLFYKPSQTEKKMKQIGKADSPAVTTEAIDHALFSPFPKTRYAVANIDGVPGKRPAVEARVLCASGF
jgi:hypothetical protein